jgi:fido (protein-threonine AMPylation protein)
LKILQGSFCEQVFLIWLINIYPWAGKYRQVNVAKDNFMFAAANQIPRLMEELETGFLRQFTPCRSTSVGDVTRAIAVVHTELVLIHPFREGNGRVARLLATLMALQAGLPPLDFGGLKGKKRKEYFAAIRAGLDRDYKPMEDLQRCDPADFEGIRKRVGSLDSDNLSSSPDGKWTPSTAVDETTVRISNLCRRCESLK